MQEMEKLQAKGEVNEEILHAMEADMTGKVHIICHVVLYRTTTILTDLTRLLAGNAL